MGKEIVYCEGCGERLQESDFLKGRAHSIDNRHYCVECKPLPPEAAKRPGSSSRVVQTLPARKSSSSQHVSLPPATTKRLRGAPAEPGTSKTPLIAGAAAGGVLILILIIAVATSSSRTTEPTDGNATTSNPGGPSGTSPKAASGPDPLEPLLRQLEAFAGSAPTPEAVLDKCDELRARLRGSPHEARFKAVEDRALSQKRARTEAGQLDAFLASIRERRKGDAEYRHFEEIRASYAKAVEIAGPRQAEVRKEKELYETSLDGAASRRAEAVRSEAAALAAADKFDEAILKVDDYPQTFRGTRHGAALETYRKELEQKWSDSLTSARDQIAAVWKAWKIVSDPKPDTTGHLESHAGRKNVYKTHPLDRGKCASLEREVEIPAGKRARLSLWVAPHEKGDWELRILADATLLHQQDIGPAGSGWRELTVDLSSLAGKKFKLRLEHHNTGWSWEWAYWSDIKVE